MTRDPSIARNTLWNFAGTALPLAVAIFAIPPLIHGLGTERFGVLTIAWTIMGYFALFDLGLGMATTKFVAGHIARGSLEQLPRLVWTSLTAHAALGILGGVLLAALTPWLAGAFLRIPESLVPEVRATFYLLALSVPMVVVTACLRGVLEAVRRFDLVNLIRIPAGITNYLAPVLVLLFTSNLVAVVGVIVCVRGLVLVVHAFLSFRQLPVAAGRYVFASNELRPLLGFGSWLTISSLLGPLIVLIDRFAIGALLSMSAVAYYATPYEVVTKLWVFSASLLAAMFPVLSAHAIAPGKEIRALYRRATRYLLVLVAPIVGLLLALADDLLAVWIGPEFSRASTPAARWLALGVLINVLAQVPYTVLLGMGDAGIAARRQLVQLPFYAVAIWWLIGVFGVTGAAIAWAVRAGVDFLLLAAAAQRRMPTADTAQPGIRLHQVAVVAAALLLFWLCGTAIPGAPALKFAATGALFALFVAWEWACVFDAADRGILRDMAGRAFGILGR